MLCFGERFSFNFFKFYYLNKSSETGTENYNIAKYELCVGAKGLYKSVENGSRMRYPSAVDTFTGSNCPDEFLKLLNYSIVRSK